MTGLIIAFWILAFIVVYTYVGYGLLLFFMVRIKRIFKGRPSWPEPGSFELPELTLLIAAYNEKDFVDIKVQNTRQLNYPAEKLTQMWVSDGSDDGTPEMLKEYKDVTLLHRDERKGKIAAMNRGVEEVKTPIVVFSDANTMLGKESVMRIAQMFTNPEVGCVSGEKRIMNEETEAASAAGEGFYWKYESALKKWDAELNSVVGAAGELFAIRRELFREVEGDTLLDDFIISLRVAMQGYKIQYDPDAYAIEKASLNVKEELKRKIRIAAGGIQSIVRLAPLLNIFKYGMLSFQYISHRVLRWTITPLCLPALLVINYLLMDSSPFYMYLFYAQLLFYLMALGGRLLEHFKIKFKIFFIPYYFFIMNYAVYLGFFRYIRKAQGVTWERAKRG